MEFPTQITDQFDNAAKTVVDTNEQIVDTIVSVNRRVVDNAVETADRFPTVELPLADKLLTPAEAGARYIDFVEQAASFERDMTARVIHMLPTGVATTAKTKATKAAK